jgi:hypothetical protein
MIISKIFGGMIPVGALCAVLILSGCTSDKSKPDFDRLINNLSTSEGVTKDKNHFTTLITETLEKPAYASSIVYLVAAKAAVNVERMEDAGFLLYAGKARARLEIFVTAPDPSSEGALISALRMTVGETVNPAIVKRPEIYKSVRDRIEAWDIMPHENYDFPWLKRGNPKTGSQIIEKGAQIKQDLLTQMDTFYSLIIIPEYFVAMQTIQRYNLNLNFDQRKDPNEIGQYERAILTIKTIEASKSDNHKLLTTALEDSL